MQNHELNKDNNRHTKTDGGMATRPQSYTKNYKRLRSAVSGGNSSLSGESTPVDYLVPNAQLWKHTYKWLSPIYAYICAYSRNSWKKRPWIWKRTRRDIWESLEARKGKWYNLKSKKNNKKNKAGDGVSLEEKLTDLKDRQEDDFIIKDLYTF